MAQVRYHPAAQSSPHQNLPSSPPTHRAASHTGLSPEEIPPPDLTQEGAREGRGGSPGSKEVTHSDQRHVSLPKTHLNTLEGTNIKRWNKTHPYGPYPAGIHPYLLWILSYPTTTQGHSEELKSRRRRSAKGKACRCIRESAPGLPWTCTTINVLKTQATYDH